MAVEITAMQPAPPETWETRNPHPEAAAVWQGVDRICRSAEFARSKRMVSLLRFLVDAFFADEIDRLSERSIGQAIFARPDDWDPTTDTIVRSEVRRLRTKLQAYYDSVGSSDPVKIIVPKGAYIPRFEVSMSPASVAHLEAADPQPSRRALGRWLGLVAACVSVAGGVWLVHGRNTLHREVTYKTVPFTSDLGQEFSPTFSPDGQWIAYAARQSGDETRLYIKAANGKGLRAVTEAGKISLFPAWSPDGHLLAYLEVQPKQVLVRVHRISDVSGDGSDRTVTAITRETGRWSDQPSLLLGNPGPIWMPDGRLIVADCAPHHCGLVLVGSDGTRSWLTSAPGDGRDFYPRLSPDGSTVAFVRYYSHGSSDIYSIPARGGEPVRVTHEQKAIQGIAWDPDGRTLVASWDRDGAFALWRIRPGGQSEKLRIDASAPAEPSVSSAGVMAYVESTENWNIWRAPLTASGMGRPTLFLSSSGRNYDPRYSADGRQIAFVSDRSGNMQLWTANADGSELKQRTAIAGAWMGGISWSPDGATIAFDARPEGHSSIYLIDLASNTVRRLQSNSFEERMPSFSRDGRSLYYNSTRNGEVDIWRSDLKSGAVQKFQIPDAFAAAELDEADTLVLASRHGEIWRYRPSNPTPIRWSGVTASPELSWFPSVSGLFFTQRRSTGEFELCRAVESATKCLGTFPGALVLNGPDIALSPDGHWILFAEQDASSGDIKLAMPQ